MVSQRCSFEHHPKWQDAVYGFESLKSWSGVLWWAFDDIRKFYSYGKLLTRMLLGYSEYKSTRETDSFLTEPSSVLRRKKNGIRTMMSKRENRNKNRELENKKKLLFEMPTHKSISLRTSQHCKCLDWFQWNHFTSPSLWDVPQSCLARCGSTKNSTQSILGMTLDIEAFAPKLWSLFTELWDSHEALQIIWYRLSP